MIFYQSAAPVGWTRAEYSVNRLVLINNADGGSTPGSHDPFNCDRVPPHTHNIIPSEHMHNMDSYPADHSGRSSFAYPITTEGNYYTDSVSDVSLSISDNSGARNINIRAFKCLVARYDGPIAWAQALDADQAVTVEMLESLSDFPTEVPPGSSMFFYDAVAPLGWRQEYPADEFYALVICPDAGGINNGPDDPTNITSVPLHSHEISPNPHNHDLYDQDDMTDGGGGEECDPGSSPLPSKETTLTIQNTGPGIGTLSPYWSGMIWCTKEATLKKDLFKALEGTTAVTIEMLEYLFDITTSFPTGCHALFAQQNAPDGWSLHEPAHPRSIAVSHKNFGGMDGGLIDPLTISIIPPHTHGISPNPHNHTVYKRSDGSGAGSGGPEFVISDGENAVQPMLLPKKLEVLENSGVDIRFNYLNVLLCQKN